MYNYSIFHYPKNRRLKKQILVGNDPKWQQRDLVLSKERRDKNQAPWWSGTFCLMNSQFVVDNSGQNNSGQAASAPAQTLLAGWRLEHFFKRLFSVTNVLCNEFFPLQNQDNF